MPLPTNFTRAIYAGCLLLAVSPGLIADEPRGQAEFARTVEPLLRQYCGECHAQDTSGSKWSFERYEGYGALAADQAAWARVRQMVGMHLMPPTGETAPSEEERRKLLQWIDDTVFYVDRQRPDPGRLTLRRLNRAEYDNTVRDIFQVECRPADLFPPDDAGYGFDNNGDVLTVSALHIEKFYAAARQVVDEVLHSESPPRVGVELTADKLQIFAGEPRPQGKTWHLFSTADEVGTSVFIPVPSTYRILVRGATANDVHNNRLSFEILCDGKPLTEMAAREWKKPGGELGLVPILVTLSEGEHRVAVRLKSAPADAAGEPLGAVGFLAVSGPMTPQPPQVAPFLQASLGGRGAARFAGVPLLKLSGEELDGGTGRSNSDTGRVWFASNGFRRTPLWLAEAGTYRIRFKVGAQQVGSEPVQFEVRFGQQRLGPFTVTAEAQSEQWLETTSPLPAGELDWQVWFINEFQDPATGAERWFWLHEFSLEGPLENHSEPTRDELLAVLRETGRRLYRRPLDSEELEKVERLVDEGLAAGKPTRDALRPALQALLLSPRFIYHPLPQPAAAAGNGTAWIDEFTLASRLSYFLWSSAPDDELLVLAERGELRASLRQQVARMIRDPRSSALTANFAGQWLRLRDLDLVAPDRTTFPAFDQALADDMRRETELLFEHILRENRSILDFLEADYSFLNARLAAHYNLPSLADEGFQRVSLQNTPRRGALTHASILTLTSHPTRTAPVKRGKWILEQMLGQEPPPPPPDVPSLPAASADDRQSLRKQLEQHRDNASCASCHALLDPFGFALENFDAIGRWRNQEGGQPIDASGRLITGESFKDWTELRAILIEKRRDEFVRCLTEQLLTYALGRGVTWRDKHFVDQIQAQSAPSRFAFQDVIVAVCESIPFQRMREPTP